MVLQLISIFYSIDIYTLNKYCRIFFCPNVSKVWDFASLGQKKYFVWQQKIVFFLINQSEHFNSIYKKGNVPLLKKLTRFEYLNSIDSFSPSLNGKNFIFLIELRFTQMKLTRLTWQKCQLTCSDWFIEETTNFGLPDNNFF